MTQLCIELDTLRPAERRDLANALLRAAWSAALEETRILLLDLLVGVGEPIAEGPPVGDADPSPARDDGSDCTGR